MAKRKAKANEAPKIDADVANALKKYSALLKKIAENDGCRNYQNQIDILQVVQNMSYEFDFVQNLEIRDYAFKWCAYNREWISRMVKETGDDKYNEMYWATMLFEAQNRNLDAYYLYVEKNRPRERQFYLPRRKIFLKHGITQALQAALDKKIELLAISMPPGTGKSTAGIYLLSGCMGWESEKPNLASGHSGTLTRSFYDGVRQIITNKDEYSWQEIFPNVDFNARKDLNSNEQTINVGLPKRFKSLTCRPINASLTGATRCENILYADDLCSGIEEALSQERLDKLWQTYVTDLASRKKMGVTEIHIQTRWSINDVVGRLEREFEGKDGAMFLNVPALDGYGNSNFDYDSDVGFTTKYFLSMKKRYAGDRASWDALFMGRPVEREGYLYHPDDFRRFYELPTEEPDAILGICDTKDRGNDYMYLPIFYQYGDNYYLADIAYTEHDVDVCERFATDIIVKHNPQIVQFESNSAGGVIADNVQKRVSEAGARTKILKKFTTANKETKIIVNAPWIREHVLLLDASKYTPDSYYGRALGALFSYNVSGKNKHDDVPDGMAMFAEFCGNKREPKSSRIIQSPF